MERAVLNVGRPSRLPKHDGRRELCLAVAFSLLLNSARVIALPPGTTSSQHRAPLNEAVALVDDSARATRNHFTPPAGQCHARTMEIAAPNPTLLAFVWHTGWFRLAVELVFVAAAAAVLWHILRNWRREAREKLEERKRARELLAREHARRVSAERESRTLSQRLLAAHEAERSHLARELHDDVTQRLARLAIDAAQLERGAVAPDVPTARSIREELVRLSEDVHSLAYRLHPSILEELGLVEALRAECDRLSRHEPIRVNLKLRDVPRDIPREAAFALFRVAQEALRNVARHAHAHGVEVSVAMMDGGLQLAVRDDGVGFDPAQTRNRPSLGHACMKERISLVEGELDIESPPGHGTTIVAWVPLKEVLRA